MASPQATVLGKRRKPGHTGGRLFLSLVAALTLVLIVIVGSVQAQAKTLYWDSYQVDITILPSGDFRVVETQHLVFTSGTFRYGIRHIPLDYVEDITDVAVSEAGGVVYRPAQTDEPFTFRTYRSDNTLHIRYNFPPTADSSRIIVIEYTVRGGLLYYEGGDQLVWKAIPADANFPIQQAIVTVHLPEGATVDNYDASGPPGQATLIDGGRGVRFIANKPMRGGPDFAIRVQWPHGIVAGEPSAWQLEMDRMDRIRPLADLGALAFSILALVGGLLGLYLLWYTKGRDAVVKLPADWIPEPPSDLPAGMVGTLIDERADMKDIIASLIDLARRGVLSIQEVTSEGALSIGVKHDFIYHLEDTSLPMRPFEKLLIDKLFGNEREKKLSDLKHKFYQYVPEVQKALYQATVEEGYFPSSPQKTRSLYASIGIAALVVTGALGCAALSLLSSYTNLAICIPLAFAVPSLGLIGLARVMPRKTRKGAEEAAKWLAFKRYLENIEKYTKLEEAKEIFDRYLPYAIAFGLEEDWIRKFAQVDAPAPPWYYPGPYLGPRPRRYDWWVPTPASTGGRGQGQAAPAPEGGQRGVPSLSEASRGMGASLANMSAGLGAMLSSAASTFSSRPAAQRGSGSWGGRSWSGGGGFSGGGWSGGGGFSGGGGGGSSFG